MSGRGPEYVPQRLLLCLLLLVLPLGEVGCSKLEPATQPTEVRTATAALCDWGEHTQGLNFVVGYDAGMAKARAFKKPVLLFVTESQCAWSKRLASENFNDPLFREVLGEFVLVIVDRHREREVADRLGATQSPFIAVGVPVPRHRPYPIVTHYVPRPEFERSFSKMFERLGLDLG